MKGKNKRPQLFFSLGSNRNKAQTYTSFYHYGVFIYGRGNLILKDEILPTKKGCLIGQPF
ncbi:hypothetical protein [Gillisia limnaea]|uniref:Uncharacterized protein n=1 Tax=Gillisia limnaea (strain DSM 15749 / LMG 21470 / R-8282) TaxID=865937 RepID=H2BS23_GILLR|nr:hypothetical protein [Gillisia limnaea]EHQ03549.1 hypothetical protein Gilli_2938 [Gillisia limnaea DSM 15749]